MDKDLTHLLTEEIDKELLSKLPRWFVIVREAYKEKISAKKEYRAYI